MNFDYELFKKLSASDVWLEEDQHVYIHKKTKERFISVTTALNLIKTPFEKQPVTEGLVRQYNIFFDWAESVNLPFNKAVRFLHLYVNYKNYRPYEIKTSRWNGQEYKSYKKLNQYEYPTPLHFENEFLLLENKFKDDLERFKTIYLTESGTIMNTSQIHTMWQDITDIANIYGTMVHEIVEQYILLKQFFIQRNSQLEKNIHNNFLLLQEKSSIFDQKYKYSLHTFEEYKIDCSYEEFKKHIINSFNALKMNLGRVCVPEKVLYHPKYSICGTQDVYVDLDDKNCDVGDHKTNKDFTYTSEFDTYLKAPFNHLEQTDFNLYNFQLSIYGLINEEIWKKKVNEIWISYYSRKNKAFEQIDLPFLKEEAQVLLDMFKNHVDSRREVYEGNGILKNVPDAYKNHLIKLIDADIDRRKKNGSLFETKEENKKHYEKFIQKYLEKQKKIDLSV